MIKKKNSEEDKTKKTKKKLFPKPLCLVLQAGNQQSPQFCKALAFDVKSLIKSPICQLKHKKPI